VRSALPLLPARSRWEQATGNAFDPEQWRGTIGGVGDGNVGKDVAEHEWAGGVGRAASAMPVSKATTTNPSSPCSIGSTHGVLGLAAAAPWHRSGCSARSIVCPQRGRIRGRGRALRTCLQGSALSIGSGGANCFCPAAPWMSGTLASG
jgi:hypothetical protein